MRASPTCISCRSRSAPASQADAVTAERPDSVLTTLTSSSGIAVLHDATVREDFRHIELTLIERERIRFRSHASIVPASVVAQANSCRSGRSEAALPRNSFDRVHATAKPSRMSLPSAAIAAGCATRRGSIRAASRRFRETGVIRRTAHESPGSTASSQQTRASSAFRELKIAQPLQSRVGSAEQSNTSIIYGDALILKLFRRLQTGENPDVEIGRFLTEVAHFDRIPPFLGEISMTSSAGEKTTIAMLQGLVANEGDGWAWFLRQLSKFYERRRIQYQMCRMCPSQNSKAQRLVGSDARQPDTRHGGSSASGSSHGGNASRIELLRD